MAVTYNITKYLDVLTLFNEGNTSFVYKIYRVNCEENIFLMQGTLQANSSFILSVLQKDDQYKIDFIENNIVTDTTTVSVYNSLLNFIIKSTEDLICDCKCKEEECKKSNCFLSSQFSAYYFLNSSIIQNTYLRLVSSYFQCRLNELIDCNFRQNLIYGKAEYTELIKEDIIIKYISSYYYELSLTTNTISVDFLKAKFKTASIFPCIKKLGINFNEIENLLP
jgi:hypothetical protein